MDLARQKLEVARVNLEAGLSEDAAGAAYFVMLNAARAALSELDLYAKTHHGTWTLFSEHFVKSGRVAATLSGEAEEAREFREKADYRGGGATAEEAVKTIERAERFLAEIERVTD